MSRDDASTTNPRLPHSDDAVRTILRGTRPYVD
jgi:hypothetical protein